MFKSDVEAADAFIKKYQLLKSEISKVIIGQDVVLDQILISVFSKGHCLLVGVPVVTNGVCVLQDGKKHLKMGALQELSLKQPMKKHWI